MDRPTIYEYAGGAPAFLAVATDFHARCLADPVLEHPFSHPGQNPDHVTRLAAYWGEVFGGPDSGLDQSAVLYLHAGTGAETDLGERFLSCFDAAVAAADLPDDPDLRAAMHDYMRWAVDEVMALSPKGSVVPPGLSAPRWDWTGLHRAADPPPPA